MKRICVYCGSSQGENPLYADMAKRLGEALVARKIGLVYGGGKVGLMGRIADTVLAGNGDVIGVIPELFATAVAHNGITRLHVVESMHERKRMMFELADAFMALPGGFGTMEEILEMLTWAQIGLHKKPCSLINVNGYYDPLLRLLENAVSNKFLKREHLEILIVGNDPEEILNRMDTSRIPDIEKWEEAPDPERP